MVVEFESKLDWERYWNGPEFHGDADALLVLVPGAAAYVWHDVVTVRGLEHSTLESVAE